MECTRGEQYAADTEMLGHDSALPQDVAHELAAVGAWGRGAFVSTIPAALNEVESHHHSAPYKLVGEQPATASKFDLIPES